MFWVFLFVSFLLRWPTQADSRDAPCIGQLIKKLTTQKTQNIKKSSISSILSITITIITAITMMKIMIILSQYLTWRKTWGRPLPSSPPREPAASSQTPWTTSLQGNFLYFIFVCTLLSTPWTTPRWGNFLFLWFFVFTLYLSTLLSTLWRTYLIVRFFSYFFLWNLLWNTISKIQISKSADWRN